ncbi:hypothetical protein CspeluHIS016_0100580 [Cutaneotrichosporon spelunceum]|uniref:BHLH domain-containing protein n=1 Tax=Cutaneotrichosporon spelunceum TaxID=1672016 RepID=A0AAD3TN33_9TREE|nr:hypothetical protein CspeluHIS016_0100580 [Cutaneotrichosporon spelunceum]
MSADDRRSRERSGPASARASAEPAPDLFPTLLQGGRENTLENLAQHAVELHDAVDPTDDISLATFHHDNSFFTASGEARFGMLDDKRDEYEIHALQDDAAAAVAAVEATSRRKRRRDEDGVVGPVENGEPIDPIKMKKDSHKEVERRRRENINEGILEIVSQVPGGSDPKVGKGILLKRASDYLMSLKAKVEQFNVELAAKEREKQEYVNELDRTRIMLEKADAGSVKWESAWRDAEDRVAQAQFELAEAKQRVAELEKPRAE